MDLNWNLSRLYESFDSENFKNDLKNVEAVAQTYETFIKDLLASGKEPVAIMEAYIKKVTEMELQFAPLGSFASLSFSTDSSNNDALSTVQKLQNLQSALVAPNVLFKNWLADLEDLETLIQSSEILKQHTFYLNKIVDQKKYTLSEEVEAVVAKLRTTGSRAWATFQQKTASSMTADVNIDGEIKNLPLQAIRNLAFEKDPAKRKMGYETEMKLYKANEASTAAALNGLKGEALTLCDLRGFESPLHQTLFQSNMKKETLDAMLGAMEDSLPKFREYFKKKAELLGHKNGLPFYDIWAPMGESTISYTIEEASNFVLDQFKTYSQELHDLAKEAFDNNWIDWEPYKGKAGGAFCARVLPLQESRVLMNFTGKMNNVKTLAHELGHAFHNYNLFKHETLNMGSPMPLAETASIFCETIVNNAALKKADQKTAISILEVALQGYSQVIVDIYSRFLFESSVFENRKKGSMSPDELKELMLNAQRKAFGDGLDPDVLHPYMWMNKPHYYRPDLDFYNFPYAFGLLFAKGLYAKYKEMGDTFVGKFNELLSSTKRMTIEECAMIMDIDVTSKDFWASSLNEIAGEIDKFIALT